jgi:hypothetical protein
MEMGCDCSTPEESELPKVKLMRECSGLGEEASMSESARVTQRMEA